MFEKPQFRIDTEETGLNYGRYKIEPLEPGYGTTLGNALRRILLRSLEGIAISLVGAVFGLALGLVTARYLNGILSDFPGLPMAIDFFLFQPRDAWTALGLLTGGGILAGIYPAWRASSLPIATTLRQEAIA